MKYIFIDSNQYRHLFSTSEGFSDSVYELLLKLVQTEHVKLLLPQQTKEEVERNRFRSWPESIIKNSENNIKKLQGQLEKATREFSEYRGYKKLKSELEEQVNRIKKEQESIRKTFISSHSKQNLKLRKLFGCALIIKETSEIREQAQIRHQKGNPPYDKEGIGDSLIWDSLLSYLPKRVHLIFVAHDSDAWGDATFDKWLENEFKEKIKGKISYSKKLSDIPDLTTEEQEKIRKEELENLKRNAVNDFINSQNFTDAGRKAKNLIQFKNILTASDYKDILHASITNHEIYQSFFTTDPLTELVAGTDGYVSKEIESLDSDLWNRFAKGYGISLKRQSDQQEEKESDIHEDIQF